MLFEDPWLGLIRVELSEPKEEPHGPLCQCVECLPHERTVTVEDVSGVVIEVPESEAPQF